MGFVGRGVRMSKRIMAELACYVSVNILEWDKHDVESMVQTIGNKEDVIIFLNTYQNRFNVQLENLIEWAENAEV